MASSSSEELSPMRCLGTRLVVLITPTNNDDSATPNLPVEGLAVVYELQRGRPDGCSNSEWPQLRIEVGTNHLVYRGEIDVSKVRLPDVQKSEISNYLLQDARKHPEISVRFKHSNDLECLELVIQQRLASANLQKFVYTGTLLPTKKTTAATQYTTESPILHFCHSLGNAVNELDKQMKSLQHEILNKQKSIDLWKETAQQLDKEVWQKEKDQLVHNFLKLWNERQDRAKKQFQEIRDELELTKAALAAKTNEKKKGRALKLDESKLGGDDLVARSEPVPLDEVAALAAGEKLPSTTTRQSILKQEDIVSVATLMQQAKEYEKRKRNALPPTEDGTFSDTDVVVLKGGKNSGLSKKAKRDATPTPRKYTSRTNNSKYIKNSPPGPVSSPTLGRASPDSMEEALRAQIRAGIQKYKNLPSSEDEKDDGVFNDPDNESNDKPDGPDWDLSF